MTRTALKLGAFILVCLFLTVVLAFQIGNINLRDPLARNNYELVATFDDVTGLLRADNVKIAGVVVGRVESIKVVDGRARVTFRVNNKYKLPTDTSAAIRWRNLIGQRYLYLYPGKSSTMLESGDVITSTKSVVDLGELFNRLGPLVAAIDPAKVNEFLDTMSTALQGNQADISKAIDDLATLASGLAERDDEIGRLIENLNTVAGTLTTRDQQIRTMLDNLVLIAQTFSANTDILDNAVTQFGTFSTALASLLDNNQGELDRLLSNLDLIVQTVGDKLPVLADALPLLDDATMRVFNSSRLGEWLNESILCFSAAPPPDGCDLPIIKSVDNVQPPGSARSSLEGIVLGALVAR